jgi:hypothetical protein
VGQACGRGGRVRGPALEDQHHRPQEMGLTVTDLQSARDRPCS